MFLLRETAFDFASKIPRYYSSRLRASPPLLETKFHNKTIMFSLLVFSFWKISYFLPLFAILCEVPDQSSTT